MNDDEVCWLLHLIAIMLHYLSFFVAVSLWAGYEEIITDFEVQIQFLFTKVLLLSKHFVYKVDDHFAMVWQDTRV
jgi:hypothetical protein